MPPTPQQLRLAELAVRNALAEESGEAAPGKLTARQRIHFLLDPGTFAETGKLVTHRFEDSPRIPGDGVITGHGRIHGSTVFVFAQDPAVFGGSVSEANAAKIVGTIDSALRAAAPILGLYDSVGPRVQEGVVALAGQAEILFHTTRASGRIPHISAILGPCTGATALIPALTDFIVTTQPLPEAHFLAQTDQQALTTLRELLAFLPAAKPVASPAPTPDDPVLNTILPEDPTQPYDIIDVLRKIVDAAALLQIHAHVAANIVTAFARLDGRPVGIVANQPATLAGILDAGACQKATHFVHFCSAFNIPLITFVDTPGLEPDQPGLPRHAAALLAAFAHAKVPKLTVTLRRSAGAAYCILSPSQLHADLNLAWPTAEITVLAPEQAVNLLYQQQFDHALRTAQAIWPQGKPFSESEKFAIVADLRDEKLAAYRERSSSPYPAGERGYLDAIIPPSSTRNSLIAALDALLVEYRPDPTPDSH